MGRSAVVRFGVLASIATFACWSGNKAPRETPLENRGPLTAASDDNVTPYWCSIKDGEYEYPQMPCAIQNVDGRLILAKLAGSQRFRGVVQPRNGGFTFDGEFYCPWGDCTKRLVGVFERVGDGALRGTFEGDTMIVTLVPAPATSAWGGASYGGDGYGGFAYGGYGYGGFGYGGASPKRRRH